MVRKRGKSYYFEFMISGQRYNGVCKGCTTKTEAERFEKERRRLAEKAVAQKSAAAFLENFKDELTGGKPILLAEAFDLYLQKPAKREAKPEQIRKNRTYWNDFLAFMSSSYPSIERLSQVTRQQAEAYVMYLRKHGPFNRVITATSSTGKVSTYKTQAEKFSHRTINGRHKAVKAVFNRLTEDAGLLNNPFDIPVLENDTVNRDIFTPEEIELIGNNITMPIIRPVFTIGFSTGLTLGDICLLKWEDITEGWINKRRRKTGSKLEIPILPPLAAFLEEQRCNGIDKTSEYVAPELAQMYQNNPSGVQYRIRKFLSGLGIKTDVQQEGKRAISIKAAHAMRHTFAYFASIHGIPLNTVQGLLGHMSPEMTLMYQKHSQRQETEKLLRQMPSFFQQSAKAIPAITINEETPERKKLKDLADTLPIEDVRELVAYSSNLHSAEEATVIKECPIELQGHHTSTTIANFAAMANSMDVPDLFEWAERERCIQLQFSF